MDRFTFTRSENSGTDFEGGIRLFSLGFFDSAELCCRTGCRDIMQEGTDPQAPHCEEAHKAVELLNQRVLSLAVLQ